MSITISDHSTTTVKYVSQYLVFRRHFTFLCATAAQTIAVTMVKIENLEWSKRFGVHVDSSVLFFKRLPKSSFKAHSAELKNDYHLKLLQIER